MSAAARSWLWELPARGLVHRQGQWLACADRSLGDAWGLLAPLRSGPQGWEIAAPDDGVLELARVTVDTPRALQPPPQAEAASHFLCLLRYDHPAERPASGFRSAFRPLTTIADSVAAETESELPTEDKASVAQLRGVLRMLQRHHGPELEREFVRAQEPSPQGDALCFAFASCQFPAGMTDRAPANASCRTLARRFAGGAAAPTRLLLLGDQVYTDATYGLLDPARLDDRYRSPYEELLSGGGPLRQLPQDLRAVMRMTLDDHEIADDWEPANSAPDPLHARGLAAYWQHQRGEEPRRAAELAATRAPVWMQEEDAAAGWRLFMADTRTARDPRDEATVREALILGAGQTSALHAWLREAPRDALKIVSSAAMLLPRTRLHAGEPLYQADWQGYPASLHGLLALLCDAQIPNVVFVSGDAHLACSARVTVSGGGRRCVFESHHAPALYAPFPFANESRWNLLLKDRFRFAHAGRSYACRVAAKVAAAGVHGRGLLHARRAAAGWEVRPELLAADPQA